MASIIRTDALQNLNTSNIISQTNATTITVGASGQTISLAGGASSSGFGATYNSGLNWTSTLVTSALTVSAGTGYFVNTSTAAITVTLPASPTFGSIVGINDYSGYASTNNITVNPNGNKLEGGTSNKLITTNKESVFLTYTDTTRGWLATSGVNNGSDALSPEPYSVEYLVVAGGGGGGRDVGGGGGAGGLLGNSFQASPGISYTITIGAGGAGSVAPSQPNSGSTGSNSSISGTGITTVTANGGGGGGSYEAFNGLSGGSGGGGGGASSGTGLGASGTSGQGNAGGNGLASGAAGAGGGGGGASASGTAASGSTTAGNGGNGSSAYSAWGSATTSGQNVAGTYYFAGGGAGCNDSTAAGTGGYGGGSTTSSGQAQNATANTGGGASGGGFAPGNANGGIGGSGIIILRYSGSQRGTGGTVVSSGGYTYHTFTATSSYTG